MRPSRKSGDRRHLRSRSTLTAVATTLGLALGLGALILPSAGSSAEAAVPRNTAEPRISGRAEQGRTLSAARGTWSGGSLTYAYRWVRCGVGGGLPDGSDCVAISGATGSTYVLDERRRRVSHARARHRNQPGRIPDRRVESHGHGRRATRADEPAERARGRACRHGGTAEPGTWTGRQPITFAYRWLRCNSAGGDCVEIAGATGRTYRVTSADVGRKLRFNVTARNAIASVTVISGESTTGAEPLPAGAVKLPSGEYSIPATSVSSNQRLVVADVKFSPNRVTNRRQTIVVRIRVKDSRAFVVRDAFVFIRSTPKVTTGGDRSLTAADGWLTYELVPTSSFPTKAKTAVQFFVKAYRSGDPSLGGVYGSRLVQVPVRLG